MTTGAQSCRRCGAALNPSETRGLCPACLLATSLAPEEQPTVPDPVDQAWLERFQMAPKLDPPGRPQRLGDYELLEEIGRGGMGVIYRARQVSLNRFVAVKTILTGPLASPEFAHRFQTEAHAAAVLDHPNIVPIYEVGDHQGQPFYSMRLVPGRNLAEEIKKTGAMPAHRAAALVATLAHAVHYAHQRGVLHRDLKPGNILLDAEGNPHVTDFGLAKLVELEEDLTRTATVLGTPNYLAPEQATDGPRLSTVAVDVYGLGAVLYHLLTGKPPFEANSALNTLRLLLDSEPAGPRTFDPQIPGDIEAICLKAMSRKPERRYPSAVAMAEELERFLRHEPVHARPITRRQRLLRWTQRNPVAAVLSGTIAFLALALLVGIPWALWRISSEKNRAVHRADEATEQRHQAEGNLRRQQVARIEMLFRTDHADDAVALLGQLYAQNPKDGRFAQWIANELTHRNFALPIVGPLVHEDRVCLVRFSPDGRRLLTATRGNFAQVWDVSSGRRLGSRLEHQAGLANTEAFLGGAHPICAEFSPDGRWVATASVDKTAQIWEAETGHPHGGRLQHSGWVSFVRFSPDGKLLATASEDGLARLWEVATGQPVGDGFRHEKWVNTVVFSPDGKRVLTASDDKTARVWDIASGRPVTEPMRHVDWVRAAVFSPDGRLVGTASSDKTARIWDAETGSPRTAPLHHDGTLNVIQFSPDGRWLATGGYDRLVRIWRVANGELQCPPLQHASTVRSLDFSPDGLRIVTSSEDRSARVWEVRGGTPLTESLRHDDVVWSASFSPDGASVATASSDRAVFIWDVRPGKAMGGALDSYSRITGVHWTDDGHELLTVSQVARLFDADQENVIRGSFWRQGERVAVVKPIGGTRRAFVANRNGNAGIWDLGTETLLTPPISHGGPVNSAALSPDEKFVVTASRDGKARVWETSTAREICPPLTHPGAVIQVDISSDGRTVATACEDLQVRLWVVPAGTLVSGPLPHEGWVHDLVFSPDGRTLATASQDGAARLWNTSNGQLSCPLLRHRGAVLDVDFSPDGKCLASASRDGAARVWFTATGKLRAESIGFGPSVLDAGFSPDGDWLALCGEDGSVGVWDIPALQPLVTGLRHSAKVNACQFSPNGLRLATGGNDHYARVWDLFKAAGEPPGWLPELVEAVAGGGGEPLTGVGRLHQEPIQNFRSRLLSEPASDDWARWGRWFLSDRASRATGWLPDRTFELVLRKRLDVGSVPESPIYHDLIEALWIRPTDGDLNSQMAIVIASPRFPDEPDRVATVEWLSRRGLEFQATPFRGHWARACYLDLAGDYAGAAAAIEKAMAAGSENAYFWQWSAECLEKAGHFERGAFAFSKAVEFADKYLIPDRAQVFRQGQAKYLKIHGLSR